MGKVKTGNKYTSYRVLRSKRKTIALSVTEDGNIEIKAPLGCSSDFIKGFIDEKQQWIQRRLDYLDRMKSGRTERNLSSGESLKYLGKDYSLKVTHDTVSRVTARFDGQVFHIILPAHMNEADEKVKKMEAIDGLYRKLARKVLEERTAYYSDIIGVHPERISVKEQKTLWGSCSSKNNINYNWKLVMAPLKVLDYVVIHELCHMIHRNHSACFWKEVGKHMPEYLAMGDWLKLNGKKLQLNYIYAQ